MRRNQIAAEQRQILAEMAELQLRIERLEVNARVIRSAQLDRDNGMVKNG